MKKRIFAGLLTAALLLGMIPPIPTQAVGADAGTGNGAEQVHTVTPNADGTQTFTDEKADPNAAYEYVIEGSDGSREVVNVGPVLMNNTGNKINDLGTKYVKTTVGNVTSGKYLIIGANTSDAGWAIKPETNCPWDKRFLDTFRSGNEISGNYTELEWDITKNSVEQQKVKCSISDPTTHKFLTFKQKNSANTGAVTIESATQAPVITLAAGPITNAMTISGNATDGVGYLNKREDHYVGTYDNGANDNGSCFFLFKKVAFSLDAAGLKALLEQSKHYKEMEDTTTSNRRYTVESWNNFQQAKTAAQSFVNGSLTYDERTAAEAALREADTLYTNLWHSILHLTPEVKKYQDGSVQETEVAVPSILWQRTLEFNNENNGDLVVNIQHLRPDETQSDMTLKYKNIEWDWNRVSTLTTNPTMTVWDYNTDYQYASVAKRAGIVGATWKKHASDWKHSNVRKFSGEFIWPEGYDLKDTAKFVSVNDANYSRIYKYIEDQKTTNPELYDRYKDATVIPINDDMYVFMYKDGTQLQNTNYRDHMVFWSGTSGKGVWSMTPAGGDDAARTSPAVYEGKNALPAYHEVRPNMKDIDSNATVSSTSADTNNLLVHTDKWYTMADTSAVMSTLNNLYATENLAGQKMHIDMYCFNNSGEGGMDQLELKFVKRKQTSTSYTVKYYLDVVDDAHLLGTTTKTDVADNTPVTLPKGTRANELDCFKDAAIKAAGTNVVVSDGEQLGSKPYFVKIGQNNVINVLYKQNTKYDTDYTYDFGVKNTYEHTLDSTDTITNVQLVTKDPMTLEWTSGNKCTITYTPDNALRQSAVGFLDVTYTTPGNNQQVTYREAIRIHPASNVLYEQNFLTTKTLANRTGWTVNGQATNPVVTDNMNSVYGYSEAYNNANPEDSAYEATVYKANDVANNQFTLTEELHTSFKGTGFDLIGTCGVNTGTLIVRIDDPAQNNTNVKAYLIDTKFEDTTVANGLIKHVPLLHCQGLEDKKYNVTIVGGYVNHGSKGAARTMSMNDAANDDRSAVETDSVTQMYELLYAAGLTDAEIDNVEFVSVEDNASAVTYAVEDRAAAPTTPEVQPLNEMKLGIDGFRVYGATDNQKYTIDEQLCSYENVLKCVSGSLTAYVEKSTADGSYTVANYEAQGGPQNEVYLKNNNTALALKGKVDTAVPSPITQVSLRSVTGSSLTVSINGGTPITITSPVEMYYPVIANVEGIVTIEKVSGDGLLSIGNVKTYGAIMPITEADYPAVFALLNKESASPEEPQQPEETYFTPEKFDVRMDTVKIGRRTKVTITAETSKDVEYITVNGKKVKASNDKTTIKGFLQNLFDKLTGKAENPDVHKFVFTKRYPTKKLEDLNHEVISYNKDQLASKPVIAEEVSK